MNETPAGTRATGSQRTPNGQVRAKPIATPSHVDAHVPRPLILLRWLLGHLPLVAGRRIATAIGLACYWVLPGWRRRALRNMRRVLGPEAGRVAVRRAARGVFRNVALNYYDLVRASDLGPRQLGREVEVDDFAWRRLMDYLDAGHPVLIVSAHFGAIDIVGRIVAARGVRPVLIVAPVGPPWAVAMLQWLRTRNGWELLDPAEGLAAVRRLRATLTGGRMVFLMTDRTPAGTGIPAPFAGGSIWMSTTPARLALQRGALVVPAFCRRVGAGYVVDIQAPLNPPGEPPPDAATLTRRIAAVGAAAIRRDPAQWLLLAPGWDDSARRDR
ncbi:MAG TPA: lysophospholipid acyltransferase family protein [Chloroflexia bacterium]|nr:lysophospholipid acyltransferase family protein [Chloroflexia bacterium]